MSAPDSPTQIVHREMRDPARTPVRILCVEDNDLDFILIRKHLRDARFSAPVEIQRARNIGEAVSLAGVAEKRAPFDIALLDLSLPDSRGVETYRRLRTAAPRVAVAILSGNSDEDLALDLVQNGAQDYLPKDSLTPDLLKRCIIYAMKRQHHRVEMEMLTDRLRRTTEELKTTQMQLIQAEKVESLGRLASSVAHEVKNPLGVIQMGLDFLEKRLPGAGDDVDSTLSLMHDAVMRAGDDAIVIEVQDQGSGIADDILSRVFEPFFTTKPTGEGTGLGLSVCKRIIELHRGQLLVANVSAPRGLLVSIVLKSEPFTETAPTTREGPMA